MILFDHVIQIFHLADKDVRAVFRVVAFDGGFTGLTAVNRNLLGETVAADGFLQKPERRLFIPVLREQKVYGVAMFIHRTIQIASLAFHLDVRLVHPPADPHWTLAPMERLLELRAIFDDPPVNRGVIHLHAPLLHKFFDVARAQEKRRDAADAHPDTLWWEMSTFEIDRHWRSPSLCTFVQ